MLLLENLGPAPKVETPIGWKPAVEFNGTEGEATTQGYLPEEKPDFNKFLEDNKIKLAQLAVDNVKDARDMQKVVRSNTPAVLSYGITLGFFGILGSMLVYEYTPTDTKLPLLHVDGVTVGVFVMVGVGVNVFVTVGVGVTHTPPVQ